ncbi:neprilysin-21-like [Drosophila busckii]|uniref:neprilysin-21-like n=1 Tax=Drosophila busckii TaxID=30019 RepID=UPI001432EB53|nr:neprilysin-21-like [Drosophila busckii]
MPDLSVRLAFTAYRNWLNATERNPEAHKLMAKEQLPTLNYTPLQLFFISYAQLCEAAIELNAHSEAIIQLSKAAEIASFMNDSIDPCDDFYEFACARYGTINPTNNVIFTGLMETVSKGFRRKVKQLLNSPPDAKNTPEDLQVKMFYNSCLRLEQLDSTYPNKLRQIIDEFGFMPVLQGDAWQASSFDWLDTVARISHRYGIIIIIGVEVGMNVFDNKKNVMYLGGQQMALKSRSIYLDEETANYRKIYASKIAQNLHSWLGVSKELAQETANEILNFEVQLAEGMVDENEGKPLQDLAGLTTVAHMQRAYAPILDIERLVNISLGEQVTQSIYEYNAPFQQNLYKVMNETPKRIVANYIFYYLINEFGLEPVQKMNKRQSECIDLTTKFFASNLDNMVYRYYNNSKSARDIDLMWNNLKLTFEQTLKHDPLLRWMQSKTRQQAVKKLKAMTLKINTYSVEELAEEFIGLEFQEEDLLENLRRIKIQAAGLMRKKLHEPAKPLQAGEKLSYTPANILVENSIRVPVSLLQSYYLWADSYPQASVMSGSTEFEHASNLLLQYRSYIDKRVKSSARQLRNRRTYVNNAYRNWLNATERNSEAQKLMAKEKLPTLNYTPLQLFFISYAQLWCNELKPNLRNWMLAIDQHVPGKFRVIGPLSNFDEFAKEFQCAPDTPMNPVTKCQVY